MAPHDRIRVLYIMGTARSGSTMLEILLAHGKGAFGAGELTALVQDGLLGNKDCSCGRSFYECEVWGRVQKALKHQSEYYLEWARIQKRIDWHDGFLRQLFGLLRRSDWERYEQYNVELLEAVRKETGADVIVDSSKYVGRALALSRMKQIDLRVICLTRAPEGLLASFRKPNKDEQHPKRMMGVLIYYGSLLTLLRLACILLRRNVYALRYEDLLADPERVVTEIERWSGVDLDETKRRLNARAAFSTGHVVTGNRLRKKGSVRFGLNESAVLQGGIWDKLVVMLMDAWRWMLGF